MRFVSHIRQFAVTIHNEVSRPDGFGGSEVIQPFVVAQFKPDDFTVDDLRYAEHAFKGLLNGMTYELDEVTPTGIMRRLSIYDTAEHQDEWDRYDQLYTTPIVPREQGGDGRTHYPSWRDYVEQVLLSRQSDEMRLVEETPVAAPWPSYDDFAGTVDELATRVIEFGFHIPEVIAYERQHLNRPDLIQLLEEWHLEEQQKGVETIPA